MEIERTFKISLNEEDLTIINRASDIVGAIYNIVQNGGSVEVNGSQYCCDRLYRVKDFLLDLYHNGAAPLVVY